MPQLAYILNIYCNIRCFKRTTNSCLNSDISVKKLFRTPSLHALFFIIYYISSSISFQFYSNFLVVKTKNRGQLVFKHFMKQKRCVVTILQINENIHLSLVARIALQSSIHGCP